MAIAFSSNLGALTRTQALIKRLIDIGVASTGLILFGWLIVILIIVSTRETGEFGLVSQTRVGLKGRKFKIFKIRSMKSDVNIKTTITTTEDPRITRIGRWLRRWKLDELPQALNVLRGDLSMVGPRPDVPGLADRLEGDDRVILEVRPGITGPASLAFREEEAMLAKVPDPEAFNSQVLFPAKVILNKQYVENYSLFYDLALIAATVIPSLCPYLDVPVFGSDPRKPQVWISQKDACSQAECESIN